MDNSTDSGFDVLARIDELRQNNGNMSIYRLAKLSDIPQSTISTWYSKNNYPPVDKLERICHVFDITLAEFFHLDSDRSGPFTAEELKLIKKYHRLTSFNRGLLNMLARALGNKGCEEPITSVNAKEENKQN